MTIYKFCKLFLTILTLSISPNITELAAIKDNSINLDSQNREIEWGGAENLINWPA